MKHSMDPNNSYLPEQIKKRLTTRWLGQTIHFYQQLDSTNLTAMELAERDAPEGTVVIAEQQLRGRGRAGRSWHSSPRLGIYCSILLRPKLFPAKAQLLTLMTAVAVAKSINIKVGLSSTIKWPNDILVNNKKVAGILLEGRVSSTIMEYAVIGIGINVNHTSADLPDELQAGASSLRIERGEVVERSGLIGQVFLEVERLYEGLQQRDSTMILEQWRLLSATLGRHVRIIKKDKVIDGIAVNVTTEGALLVRREDGSLNLFHAGEVEHLNMSASGEEGADGRDTCS